MEMMTQGEWLSYAVEQSNCYNDAAMARRLGVTDGAMSHWKRGASNIPPERVIEISNLAGLDPETSLLLRAIWTAKPATRPVYEGLFRKLMQYAALVPLFCFGTVNPLLPQKAQAQRFQELSPLINPDQTPQEYALSDKARAIRHRALRVWGALTTPLKRILGPALQGA